MWRTNPAEEDRNYSYEDQITIAPDKLEKYDEWVLKLLNLSQANQNENDMCAASECSVRNNLCPWPNVQPFFDLMARIVFDMGRNLKILNMFCIKQILSLKYILYFTILNSFLYPVFIAISRSYPRPCRADEVSVHRACCEQATQPYLLGGGGMICPGSRPAGGYHT